MIEINELHKRIAFLARTDRAAEKIVAIMEAYGKGTFSVEFLQSFLDATNGLDVRRCENLKERPVEREVLPPSPKLAKSLPVPAPTMHVCGDCGKSVSEVHACSDKYRCIPCYGKFNDLRNAVPLPLAPTVEPEVVLMAPASGRHDISEEHTPDLNEFADLAAYVAARSSRSEPMQDFVLPAAETKQVTVVAAVETSAGQFDTDNENLSSEPTEFTGLTAHAFGVSALPVQVPAPGAPVACSPLSVSKARKRSVRLTDKEQEVAVRLGFRPSIAPTYSGRSVLDDYEPVRSAGKRSYGPPKNLLVKAVAAQGEQCGYCDRRFGALVLADGKIVMLKAVPDHFMPRAKRLNNSPTNIVAACHLCNRLKGSRIFASITQARAVLQAAWRERAWKDAPLLVPFKLTMPTCFN